MSPRSRFNKHKDINPYLIDFSKKHSKSKKQNFKTIESSKKKQIKPKPVKKMTVPNEIKN